MIFHPEPEEMYTPQFCSYVDMNGLTTELCGKTRPTHFRGVQTVVLKLFHIVTPDRAYFGQKDAQQLAVIKRMVTDLNVDVQIIGCPIIREEDGLAKSSRNTYLNAEERKAALVLSRSLKLGKELVAKGEKSAEAVKKVITEEIEKSLWQKLIMWKSLILTQSHQQKLLESPFLLQSLFTLEKRDSLTTLSWRLSI